MVRPASARMLSALACTTTLLGVAALWGAWMAGRRQSVVAWSRSALRGFGWGLLVASFGLWMQAAGPDRGLAIAGLGLSLAGLLFLVQAARSEARSRNRPARRRRTTTRTAGPRPPGPGGGLRTGLRRLWVVVLAGPVAVAAAVLLAMLLYALALAAGLQAANGLAIGLIATPLLWSLLMPVATAGLALRTRSAILLGSVAAGALAYPLLPMWVS